MSIFIARNSFRVKILLIRPDLSFPDGLGKRPGLSDDSGQTAAMLRQERNSCP